MGKTIVSVFGYSENIVPGNNPWEQVVSDRFWGAMDGEKSRREAVKAA